MAEKFETLKARRSDPARLKRAAEAIEASRLGPALDPARGQSFVVGDRQWDFLMSREATEGWDRIGREPVVVGVLVHQFEALDEPEARRFLVAVPGRGGRVNLEMRTADGSILWKGTAEMKAGALEFSMPISRPGVRGRGMVSGRVGRDGRVTLSEAKLPTPRGRAPKLDSKE